MIDEQVLERALRAEGLSYDVPPGGPDAIRDRVPATRSVRRARPRWVWGGVVATAVVALVAVAPNLSQVGNLATSDDRSGPQTGLVMDGDGETTGGGTGGGTVGEKAEGVPGQQPGAPADAAKVIRTGAMTVEVANGKVPDALRELTRLAGARRGYVSESKTDGSPDQPFGTVTLRVPVADFDSTVADAGKLGKVLVANTEGVDVTGQVTDVAARLKSLVAARTQLEALLARASNVGEVLAVQQKVTETQTQIEQLQAKQASLADQTTYGTLRVEVVEAGSGTAERTGFAKAWHDAVDGFLGGLRGLVAASGTLAFVLLLAVAAWLLGRPLYKAYVRRVV